MSRSAWYLFLAFTVLVCGLQAQRLSLTSGTRVRVWIGGEPSVGTVRGGGTSDDTLSLAPDGGGPWLVLPVATLGRVEVSRGTRAKTATGARLGAVVGMLGGLAIGAAADPQYGAAAGFALGVPMGLLVGAGVGSGIHVERWELAYDSTEGPLAAPMTQTDSLSGATSGISLSPGQRVRVQAREGRRWREGIGAITAVRGDTLVIQPDTGDSLWSVPMARIGSLKVSTGRRRHVLKGAEIGFGVGVLLDPEQSTASLMIGPAVGGLLGYLMTTERWEDPGPARLRVSLGPGVRGGLALSGSFSF